MNDPSTTTDQVAPEFLAAVAVAMGLVGLVGSIPVLPGPLLLICIGLFMFAGPGSLIMSWFTRLPVFAIFASIPLAGLAICILVVSLLLTVGFYSPATILIGLSLLTVIGGFLRRHSLERALRESYEQR